jgi:hypothetical protein
VRRRIPIWCDPYTGKCTDWPPSLAANGVIVTVHFGQKPYKGVGGNELVPNGVKLEGIPDGLGR